MDENKLNRGVKDDSQPIYNIVNQDNLIRLSSLPDDAVASVPIYFDQIEGGPEYNIIIRAVHPNDADISAINEVLEYMNQEVKPIIDRRKISNRAKIGHLHIHRDGTPLTIDISDEYKKPSDQDTDISLDLNHD